MMRQFELVERVKSYDPSADEDAINRAYVFAMKMHGSQLRASGDPYFSHPIEVAGILTRYKLDSASIITALLHDTVEDTAATPEDIKRLFGEEILRLVDGVTKLTRLELQSDQTKQAENFRKLVLAMSEDIRVLLVKLADRVHNMRTLHFIKNADKRRRIASETLEIYAPLAGRIGISEIKEELEDLAFAELHGDVRESLMARLSFLREKGGGLIGRILEELRGTLGEAGVDAAVTGREKTAYSIWRKMQLKNVAFEQLSDIMAFRVQVASIEDCYRALGVIHSRYPMVPNRLRITSRRRSRTATARFIPACSAPSAIASKSRSAPRTCTTSPSWASPRTGPTSRPGPAPRAANIAGCANWSTFWSTPRIPRSSWNIPRWKCSRTRCSASRRRAI